MLKLNISLNRFGSMLNPEWIKKSLELARKKECLSISNFLPIMSPWESIREGKLPGSDYRVCIKIRNKGFIPVGIFLQ